MTTKAGKRIAAIEALPTPQRTPTLQETHAWYVATAARCGFTEEQVMLQFGGWPAFFYAKMIGTVVDPSAPMTAPDALAAGRSPMTAYLDLVRG